MKTINLYRITECSKHGNYSTNCVSTDSKLALYKFHNFFTKGELEIEELVSDIKPDILEFILEYQLVEDFR